MINPTLIPDVYKPLEPMASWRSGFNKEELQQIVNLGEMLQFQKGALGGGADSRVDASIRETDITWLRPAQETEWIYERIRNLAARINYDKFQFDLTHFQHLQYGVYKPGGHYTWHADAGGNSTEHRKLSFVVGLSDPEDYDGGELELNVAGDPNNAISMKLVPGDVVVFPSWTIHRVKPVTRGERRSLVGWAVGPAFR